jgi:hypothetical protein
VEFTANGRLLGLTVDDGRHLLVADAGPNRIKEFSLAGTLPAIWTP